MTIHYLKPKSTPMFTKTALVAMVLTLMSFLPPPPAQAWGAARGKWWRAPDIARQIQLSEDEISRLDNIFDAAQLRMIELRGQVAMERAKLRALLEQPVLDEDAITQQHQNQQEAWNRLSAERLAFLLETRKIIGHERFIKLMEIRESQRRRHYRQKTEETQNRQ